MNVNKHSIMIIKNNVNEYLNYYDKRWNCYLFPNNKIESGQDLNKEKIFISNLLNIPEKNVEISLIFEKIHSKYSKSSKKIKKYHHFFYATKIEVQNNLSKKEFISNGISFKWFSLQELESDERITKVNGDIVEIIKNIDK